MTSADAIVVGAGPAGLACAAQLKSAGLDAMVLEKADSIGSVWRRHYDRLHLHTDRDHSGLPGLPMPRNYPKYPSRLQVIDYFERYADTFDIRPLFDVTVSTIRHRDGYWHTETAQTNFLAPIIVVATGTAGAPYRPGWPGLESFAGDVIHSGAYRNPAPYHGARVLVVGFGNSGGEIALDLAEHDIDVTLAVRGPIQVLPRDLLGLPIISWAIFYQHLPARLVDWINAPVLRLAVGRLESCGLTRARKGPRRMVEEDGRVPVFDIGTLAKIRDGSIKVRGEIAHMTPESVVFADGTHATFDAIVLATGYRPDLRPLLPGTDSVFDARGLPLATGRATGAPGLFFCGQTVSPTGQLREIGIEARRIAGLAALHVRDRHRSRDAYP